MISVYSSLCDFVESHKINQPKYRSDAIQFLEALGQCESPAQAETHPFCFQIFTQIRLGEMAPVLPEGFKHGLPEHRTGGFKFCENWLRTMNGVENGQFCGVYVVVNETDGKGRHIQNVRSVRALFVELDHGGLNDEHIAEFKERFKPSIIVESSPGKLHCYWLLKPGSCPLEKFSTVQALLQRRFEGLRADAQAKDLPRVLRVPGFLHLKNLAAPFIVTLQHCDKNQIYTPDEVFKHVTIDREFVEKFREGNAGAFQRNTPLLAPEIRDSIDPAYNEFLGAHPGHRNDSVYHYCLKHLFQHRGLNRMEALAACILANQLNDPPLEREELETIVGSAWKKFQASGAVSAPVPGQALKHFSPWTPKDRAELPSNWLREIEPDGNESYEELNFSYDYERIGMSCAISDESLADRIIQKYGPRINHAHVGGFYVYNDLIWANADGEGERLVYQMMRETFSRVPYEPAVERYFVNAKGEMQYPKLVSFQKDVHSANRLGAVSHLLSKRAELATTKDQFNREEEADIIAVPNGILDIRSGELLKPNPKYRLTHITGCPFEPTAKCPLWDYWVDSAMGSDPDLIRYLQKVTGYFLSGRTHLQSVFVAFGVGGTGKSVYLHVLSKLLAGYCHEVDKKVLVQGMGSENAKLSSLAQALHCRLATVQELSSDEKWDETMVKAISGNDPVVAKLSHKDTLTFTPRFKVCVRANNLPTSDQLDDALWARLKFLPFSVRFRGTAKEDQHLPEKLCRELPGILNWAVAGYQALMDSGLQEPAQAALQRKKSQQEAEPVRMFLEEFCEPAPAREGVKYSDFQNAFENFCRDRGLPIHGKQQIRRVLENDYGYTEASARVEGEPYPVKRLNLALKPEAVSRYTQRSNVRELRREI